MPLPLVPVTPGLKEQQGNISENFGPPVCGLIYALNYMGMSKR